MQINHDITMHLDRRVPLPVLDAVQGETARSVTLWLYDQALPWNVPEGAAILIRYRKPDSTGGVYDSMPDGSRAWEFWENAVKIRVAPQALAVAGITAMQIAVVAEGEELASFVFHLRVESDPSVGTLASQDYVNIGQWLMPYIHQLVSQAEVAAETASRAADKVLALASQISGKFNAQFTSGSIDAVTGELVASEHAIVSQYIAPMGRGLGVSFPSVVTARLFFYDEDLVYVGADLMRTESFEQQIPEEAHFVRVEVRFASGKVVTNVEELARYVTVYLPDNCLQHVLAAEEAAEAAAGAARAAQDAAQAAAADAAASIKAVNGVKPDETGNVTLELEEGCVKSVNGILPNENGNVNIEVSGEVELKPLNILRNRMEYEAVSEGVYDGKSEKSIYLPIGFSNLTEDSGLTLASIGNGLRILNGTIKVGGYNDSMYYFKNAIAFGAIRGHYHYLHIFDTTTNQHYRIVRDDRLGGQHTVQTEPLFGAGSGVAQLPALTFTGAVNASYDGTTPVNVEIPSGGGDDEWRLAKSITLEQDVSTINITTDDDGNALHFSEGFIEWYCPASTKYDGYIVLHGEKSNSPQIYSNNLCNTFEAYGLFQLENWAGKTVLSTAINGSAGNTSVRTLSRYPQLLDIGKITGVGIKAAGGTPFLAGATLELYVRG